MIPPGRVRNDARSRSAWVSPAFGGILPRFHRMPPTTLGILCDPRHPALANFPTEFNSNWQWWYLVSRPGHDPG